jgi:hypothetical protein
VGRFAQSLPYNLPTFGIRSDTDITSVIVHAEITTKRILRSWMGEFIFKRPPLLNFPHALCIGKKI